MSNRPTPETTSSVPFRLRAKDAKPGTTLYAILLENEKLERERDRLRALNAELITALATLIMTCEEAHWPVIADHMTPLAQARAAYAKAKEAK